MNRTVGFFETFGILCRRHSALRSTSPQGRASTARGSHIRQTRSRAKVVKIILNFDTEADGTQTLLLAVRAEDVRVLLVDLLSQITEWYWEKPEDEQAAAYGQVYHWLFLEIEKRGLMQATNREGVLRARDGTVLAQSRAPKNQLPSGEGTSTDSGSPSPACHQ
jgi:hypothetical protein